MRGIESAGKKVCCRSVECVEHLADLIRDGGKDRVLRIVTVEATRGEDVAEEFGERGAEVRCGERFEHAVDPREALRHGARFFRIAEHTRG